LPQEQVHELQPGVHTGRPVAANRESGTVRTWRKSALSFDRAHAGRTGPGGWMPAARALYSSLSRWDSVAPHAGGCRPGRYSGSV
jgi:hypothetical protein